MIENILSISEITEKGMAGYGITTNKQVIKMLIDDYQSCCESYGYFMSEDELSDFIGSELKGISLTDKALEKVEFKYKDELDVYDGDIMFVNIETSKGLLQFVAYNSHNGYYGHTAKVISEQLNYETTL